MPHRLLPLIVCCLLLTRAEAAYYSFTPGCAQAYEQISRLKFHKANELLAAEMKTGPENVAVDMLTNKLDFIRVFINEDKAEYEKLKPLLDQRLSRLERLPATSPYYLYCRGEFYFQWAILRLKFGEQYSAALQIRKGYKLIEENSRKFPGFLPNLKYLGFMHAAIGMVPEQYKWLASMAGFKGTLDQGIEELNQLAYCPDGSPYVHFRKEALMFLSIVHLNFQKDAAKADAIAEKLYAMNSGPLEAFLKADIALHSGQNDVVLEVAQKARAEHPDVHFPYFFYLVGNALLHKLDPSAASYFNGYTSAFKGESYVKASYLKMGWSYLLSGDEKKFRECMELVKAKGGMLIDEDKQAMTEAASGEAPNRILLKARLLFDGGYYQQALEQFAGTSIERDFPTLRDQLEVTYRVARIYHKQGNYEKAKQHYHETLKNGYRLSYYFAANSALQLGLIYEEKKDYSEAEFYFRKCLSMRDHEYQNSLDQKAKAGLGRLKKL